ncbi:hypothetical protein P3T73_01110 [Kiritimatiellota bacterium B12222]|nr:hypothetical protein P3T73_01110 [Kiritimatiellota bacterium B12222]
MTQEIGKGGKHALFDAGFHDANGGWEFSVGVDGYRMGTLLGWIPLEPQGAADEITDEELKIKPFHRRLLFPEIYDPELGPAVGRNLHDRYTLLATGIPAQSFAIAVNEASPLAIEGQPNRNFNMQSDLKSEEAETNWPSKFQDRPHDWLHSDFKDVSIQFVHPLYQKIIELAEENQE